MKPQLGILLEFGFHEVKKFIHSGLISQLSNRFDVHFFVLEKDRKSIEENFSSFGDLHFIKGSTLRLKLCFLEPYARSSSEAWLRNKGIPLFHNYKQAIKKSRWDWILGNSLFKYLIVSLAQLEVLRAYNNSEVAGLLGKSKITHVLGVSCDSALSKSFFVTAQKLGLKSFYLVNSWKDLYVSPWMPITKFSFVFVWSERMRDDYLLICPYLKPEQVIVTGNPSFYCYFNFKPKRTKEFYASKYRLNVRKKWFYYTMMPPGLWPDEIFHVLKLCDFLANKPIQVLVRKNPNHNKDDFNDLEFPINCVLTEHFTSYDKEKDFIFQTAEGESEWMDLIYYSHLNISIPSTVTLEFLALGKPIINPRFSLSGIFSDSLRQHFESGFYKPLFDLDIVKSVNNIEEFAHEIDSIFTNNCIRPYFVDGNFKLLEILIK
jgi:hypothetical protein